MRNRSILLFVIGLTLGYALAVRSWQRVRPQVPAAMVAEAQVPEQDSVSIQQSLPRWDGGPNEFTRIYDRLGLQGGDTIHSVNDVKTPEGFLKLVPAFKQGSLCVHYERESARRRVCFSRNEAGERVEDRRL